MKKRCLFLIIILIIFISTLVDAYVPVTYICCRNFSNYNGDQMDQIEDINAITGDQLDNFENLSNWTIGTGKQKADTVNFKEGNQGLELTTNGSYRVSTDKVINNSFLNKNNFSLWIYVQNGSTFEYPRIYLTSTGNSWSKYFMGSYYAGMYSGWNKLILTNKSFENYYNESWNNNMNRIRIAIKPKDGLDTNVTVDDLRYNVNSEWIMGGSNAYQEPDTVNFKEGSEGLKLVANNGDRAYSEKIIDNDFSNISNFVLWLYVYDANSFDYIRIYLTSTDSWGKYFQSSIYGPGFKTGWNKLVFGRNSFVNFYNESWNNKMNKIRIAIYPKTGQSTAATIDDLRTNMNGKRGKLIITFDDGNKNVREKAFPILSENNQPAVSFIVTSWVGDLGYMNLSDLKNLQSNGWDISSHTVNHEDLTTLNDVSLAEELNNSYDWLVNNNFQKSAGFIAYPYGAFDDKVISYVKNRYVFGRATSTTSVQPHFDSSEESELYIQRIIYVYNTTTVQSIKNLIDDSINSKLLGILLFHDIVNSNPQKFEYLESNFRQISDYIKSRSADIDVVTYSDYVIPNINKFTPVINKTTRIYSNGDSVLITNNKYDEYMPNMTVKPSSDYIDIGVTTYNETGGLVKFNESSPNKNLQVSYEIGDRIPNQAYKVEIYLSNGTKYRDFNVFADNNGYIKYTSEGFEESRHQEINISPVPLSSLINIIYNVLKGGI